MVPATRKLVASRSAAVACDAISSADSEAILPAALELALAEFGAPLDPVPLFVLEHPARITLAAAIAATVIRPPTMRISILVARALLAWCAGKASVGRLGSIVR
jgi:hypothetical protein